MTNAQSRAVRASGFVLAVLAILVVLLAVAAGPGYAQGHVYTHYQKNMSFRSNDERMLADDILSRLPDNVTLQEVNRDNDKVMRMIAQAYPSQHICSFKGIGVVAVASRWPLVPGTAECLRPLGATAIQVRMPDGPVWVVSVHLETRDKPRHARQARRLGGVLAEIGGPMIIGGDFNDLPDSKAVRNVTSGVGASRIGRAVSTRRMAGVFGVPIDFVFATGGRGATEQLPMLGSDHHGVWAEFTMSR